jgi:hypothetical protein
MRSLKRSESLVGYQLTAGGVGRCSFSRTRLKGGTRMCTRSLRSMVIGLVFVAALLSATAAEADASSPNISALVGKRVPMAPASWYRIVKGRIPLPRRYGPLWRSVEDLFVTGLGDPQYPSVQFIVFRSTSTARAYYQRPGVNLAVNQSFQRPLVGPRPASAPSRWIDLQQCLYESGPNPHQAPQGAPASTMTSSGTCPIGTATSVGLATITLRGPVVIIVNNLADDSYASPVPKPRSTEKPGVSGRGCRFRTAIDTAMGSLVTLATGRAC